MRGMSSWGLGARLGLAALSMVIGVVVGTVVDESPTVRRNILIVLGVGNVVWLVVSLIERRWLERRPSPHSEEAHALSPSESVDGHDKPGAGLWMRPGPFYLTFQASPQLMVVLAAIIVLLYAMFAACDVLLSR